MKPTRLILVAVGGQGNLLSSKVLGESALLAATHHGRGGEGLVM